MTLSDSDKLKQLRMYHVEVVREKDAEIDALKRKISHLERVSSDLRHLDLPTFLRKLGSAYEATRMPKASGIYVYYNQVDKSIYVGQSVNMYTRLQQHFRNGSVTISGHDSEFKDKDDWLYYVAEYIDRNDKQKLNERESFWIALAKQATTDKVTYQPDAVAQVMEHLSTGSVGGVNVDSLIQERHIADGNVTNRTRGNNIKM